MPAASTAGVFRPDRMPLSLHPEASFCVAAGRVIFLHSAADRYLMLPGELNDAMLAWLTAPPDVPLPPPLAELLSEVGLIAPASPGASPIAPFVAEVAQAGLEPKIVPVGIRDLLAVWRAYRRTRRVLRRHGFSNLIGRMPKKSEKPFGASDAADAARQFLRCRTLLSIKEDCLIESLSMLAYLRGRGCAAEVIFGVTAVPFQAHCWVQSAGVLLNDHPDHVSAYAPIRRA